MKVTVNGVLKEMTEDEIHKLSSCEPNKCKPRDNNFGITWCVRCGKLFKKPSNIPLQESDKMVIRIHL